MKENKIVFGKWEAVTLLINMICTKIFLNFPRATAESVGSAGWILIIYICILAFIAFFIITKLYSKFEGKDLLDISEKVGGNIGRIIVGSVVIMFLLYIISVVLREFAEDMKVISLPVSPVSFVTLLFLAGMIAGAYIGLEAIVRFHAILVPLIASGFLIILIGVLPYFEASNLLPVLGNGTFSIVGKGALQLSIFAELIFLFLLVPYIKTHKNFKRIGYTALGFSSIFLILGTLVFLGTLPYPVAIESFIPIYHLARLINFGRFFQRVESLFVLIWAAAALLYLSVGFYFIVYTFKKTFKLLYYKPLIIPFAIIVLNLSLLPPNLMNAIDLEVKYFRNYAFIITFVMTISLLLLAKFRIRDPKKELEKNENKKDK